MVYLFANIIFKKNNDKRIQNPHSRLAPNHLSLNI